VDISEFLSALEPRATLAVTLGLAVLIYVTFANLAWATRNPSSTWLGRFFAWSHRAWLARTFKELVRWLYYLALPYATLIIGFNTTRALGLAGIDLIDSAIRIVLLGIGAMAVIIWVWRPYAQIEHPHAVDNSGWNWARHIVELIYQQAHWAFYRSVPILLLNDFYWGSFIGLGIVFVEAWLNPIVRANMRDVARADAPLWTGSLAIVSTIIFLYSQNTWGAALIHLLIDLGLRKTIGFPRTHAPDEMPPSD